MEKGCKSAQADNKWKIGRNYVRDKKDLYLMATWQAQTAANTPFIALDMEVFDPGHDSPLGFLQIRASCSPITYVVDLLVLGKAAFDSTGYEGKTTLRTSLEDSGRKKLVFDVRQISGALYSNAGIKLRGVLDLQDMHMPSTCEPPVQRPSLAEAVEQACGLTLEVLEEWNEIKSREPKQ